MKHADNLYAIVVMPALLWAGVVLYHKKGTGHFFGVLLLAILFVDILQTSDIWLGYFKKFDNLVNSGFNGLERVKHA